MIPLHLFIDGIPVSLQAKKKNNLANWKARIKKAALAEIPPGSAPISCDVTVKIRYFYDQEALDVPDVDNIIKPIQDALIGVIYSDDSQVVKTSSHKSRIDSAYRIKGVPVELAVKLANGRDFVQIDILPAPDEQYLT